MVIFKENKLDSDITNKKCIKYFKQVKHVSGVRVIERDISLQDTHKLYFFFVEYTDPSYKTTINYNTRTKEMEVISNNNDPEIFFAFKMCLDSIGV